MAKYDPKRPRPTLGDDTVAPIDALIEDAPVEAGSVEAESVEAHSGEETASPRVSDVPVTPPAEEETASPRVSDVPVIPPPEEGTANRAVLTAICSGLGLLIVVAIILRLRRRKA